MKRKSTKKYLVNLVIVVIIGGSAYWYGNRAGWFNPGPNNLPTKEDWARMDEIDRTSSQIAPNAKPGVGVAAPGTLPPPPPPEPEASSTATTTDGTATTTDTTPIESDSEGTVTSEETR